MNDLQYGWKILTHDWRSPLQGGRPLCKGRLPVTLSSVALDLCQDDCAAGWNYVPEIATGWRIAGCWPTGWPAHVVAVEASADAIERGDKRRASTLTLLREATPEERHAAWIALSAPFGAHQARMVQEQEAWWEALGRLDSQPAAVKAALALALSARTLPWALHRYDTARAARDAGAAWAAWAARDAGAAWAAWAAWDAGAARAAWAARAARGAWGAWDARAARGAGAARDARAARGAGAAWAAWAARDAGAAWAAWAARDARDARGAGGAWDARDALTTMYARLMGWQKGESDQYTYGIRDAYRYGLAIALPVGPSTLGWAMKP